MLEFNRVVVDVIKTAMPNAVTWGRNTGLSSLNRGISMAWKSLRQLGSEAKLQLISTVHIWEVFTSSCLNQNHLTLGKFPEKVSVS